MGALAFVGPFWAVVGVVVGRFGSFVGAPCGVPGVYWAFLVGSWVRGVQFVQCWRPVSGGPVSG